MGYKYSMDHDFFKTDTPESFYIAGFIAADGSLEKVKNSFRINICLKSSDEPHLYKIRNELKSNHPIKKILIKNSRGNKMYSNSERSDYRFISQHIFDDLLIFNIKPNKSLTYMFPTNIINHKYLNYFMLGYFDGDGSLSLDKLRIKTRTRNARIHIRGNQEFLAVFNSILALNCNINTENKKIGFDSGIGSLQYTGNNNVYKIMSYLYRDKVLFLDRKYERFLEMFNYNGI